MTKDDFFVIPKINMSLITEEEQTGIYQILQNYNITLTQITPSQQLSVLGLPKSDREKLKQDLLSIVEHRDGIGVTYVQSCPSLNQCKYAVADSLALGRKLDQLCFSEPLPRKVKISIAACRMCCTEPYVRDVGIIATRKGWTVVFGGNAGGKPRIADKIAEGLNDEEVVILVKKSLNFYMKNTRTKQRTARFIEEFGIDNFKKKIISFLNLV